MTVASTYMIKELTAKFGRWAVNSFLVISTIIKIFGESDNQG